MAGNTSSSAPITKARADGNKPTATVTVTPPTNDDVRLRAFQIWQKAGQPEGQSETHWVQAEEELRLRIISQRN